MEALKTRFNQGESAEMYFFRDATGNEVDLLIPSARKAPRRRDQGWRDNQHRLLSRPSQLRGRLPQCAGRWQRRLWP